jgi:organic radical activating enzyme
MIINIQPIEKRVVGDGQTLDVIDIFYTIQGEGPLCGRPAVFIRLAGCNLQCPGCDTRYTQGRETLRVQEIIARVERSFADVAKHHTPIIVITGGEPFRQNLAVLVPTLTRQYLVQIETNGTLGVDDPAPFKFARIVCSPKAGKVHQSIVDMATCFKYVVHHESVSPLDGLPILALDHSASPQVARPPKGMPVYLQPMDCQDPVINKLNQDAVLASCLKFGHVLQIQIHKILGVA